MLIFILGNVLGNAQHIEDTVYRSNVVDTFFNVPVPDPYRWLEDPNSQATKNWLQLQEKLTAKARKKFKQINETEYAFRLHGGARHQGIWRENGYYFSYGNTDPLNGGSFDNGSLYYRKEINEERKLACDPSVFSMKGIVSIGGFALSNDAKYLAVALQTNGSDWRKIRVVKFKQGGVLDDEIDWAKFSNIAWWKDGFFYSRFKDVSRNKLHLEGNTRNQLCYHRVGTPQDSDVVVYSMPDDARWIMGYRTLEKDNMLLLKTTEKIGGQWYNILAYKDLNAGLQAPVMQIAVSNEEKEIHYHILDFINGKFIVESDEGAENGHLVTYIKDSVNKPVLLVPQSKSVMKWADKYGNMLVALYFYEGAYELRTFNLDGTLQHKMKFDAGLTPGGFIGDPNDTVLLVYKTAFYYPFVTCLLNLVQNKLELLERTSIRFYTGVYETKMVNYRSKDGTEVPMYITYKKGMQRNGSNPVVLYGYGGYGISVTPFYSFKNVLLFESGGILAVPQIRGGGEKGNKWHNDGKGLKKQNSFDDFIAAAQYLIHSGYTSKDHLAIEGGSNGGLLVTAVLTQRPDLFKAAVSHAGTIDMLRYPKFTGGKFWIDEYGDPNDSMAFANLLAYSPLHHVKAGVAYPATLLIAGDNDDRVPALHSFKFLAELQQKSTGDAPHLLYFEEEAGHSGSQTNDGVIDEEAFVLNFIFQQFGLKLHTDF